MERRAGSGPLGFSERSSTVKEYETLTREKVDVVPFGCGMPETHLMQDWSDRTASWRHVPRHSTRTPSSST
jgi:hypothetical protein